MRRPAQGFNAHAHAHAHAVALSLVLGLVPAAALGQVEGEELDQTPMAMTLEELGEEIALREADLQRYSERLAELEQESEQVRRELEEHEARLRLQERTLRTRLVSLSRLSRGGLVQLLLGARSWADLLRRAQLARSVVDRDAETFRAHRRAAEQLSARRRELEENLATQRALSERIAQYQQELEAERGRRLEAEQAAAAQTFAPFAPFPAFPLPPPFPSSPPAPSSYGF